MKPDPVVPEWSLADRLRKIRRDVMGAEQEEFAGALGAGRPAYSAWEAGRSTPRDVVAFAKRIEMLTGVPASWVLGLDSGHTAAAQEAAASAATAASPATARRRGPNAEKPS